MERRQFLTAAGTAATAGLAPLAGCSAGAQDTGGSAASAMDSTGTKTVKMITDGDDFYFDPIGLYVEPGETVTWVNVSDDHSATAYGHGATVTRIPDDATAFDSTVLSQEGATYDHTFEVQGTYDYFCIPHKQLGMVGRIVVGEPGGPATGSTPPDGAVPTSEAIVQQGAISYDAVSK